MAKTWILVCDASRARIFSANEKPDSWRRIEELDHPASRLKGEDITTDKQGRVRQSGSPGTAAGMAPPTNPKEVEAERFAGQLARHLGKGRNENSFDHLVLVASPHFLGLLRSALSDPVQKCIAKSIDKDLTHLEDREIEKRLHPLLSS